MTEQEESLGTELDERVGIIVALQRIFCPTTWSRTEMGAKEGGPEGNLVARTKLFSPVTWETAPSVRCPLCERQG